MLRRIASFALLFLFIANASFAERRRAISPGFGRCLFGPIADAYVSRLAVDGTDVYYLDDFDYVIYRVPKDGSLAIPLAALANLRSLVTDLVVDDTTVFFGTIPFVQSGTIPPGAIYAVPKNGGAGRIVATNVTWPVHLRVDATHVYWASFGTCNPFTDFLAVDGKIERVRKDGSARQTLVQALSGPYDLLLDGENVIFAESGLANGPVTKGVRRVPKNGGAVVHLEDTHGAADLAQTNTDIVFYGEDGDTVGLFRVPKNGGAVQLLVDDVDVSGGPKVVEQLVYFALGDDRIQRMTTTGGTPETIVVSSLYEPNDFEVDECGVYFGSESGKLTKAPR